MNDLYRARIRRLEALFEEKAETDLGDAIAAALMHVAAGLAALGFNSAMGDQREPGTTEKIAVELAQISAALRDRSQ